MPINIFGSFEFDRDNDLKNNFLEQARKNTQTPGPQLKSLDEAYPDETWRNRAREAIRECDVVVVLIGMKTPTTLKAS